MSKYVLFLPFIDYDIPIEAVEGICIWCKQPVLKPHISHIFSKKLIGKNDSRNVLRRSVCVLCNRKFSDTCEDWVYKYTPITTWVDRHVQKKEVNGGFRYVPNFIYCDELAEWLIISHDIKRREVIYTQIIIQDDLSPICVFGNEFSNDVGDTKSYISSFHELIREVNNDISKKHFGKYVSKRLPDDFRPRLFIYRDVPTFVCRSESEFENIRAIIADNSEGDFSVSEVDIFNKISKYTVHYKWSIKKYLRLCTKFAFEALCLFEGADYCLSPLFDSLRNQIFCSEKDDIQTIVYEEQEGLRVNRLTPPGWITWSPHLGNRDRKIPAFSFDSKKSHDLILFEFDGLILATIKMFDIDLMQVVLGKAPRRLKTNYAIRYYLEEEKFRYFRQRLGAEDEKKSIRIHTEDTATALVNKEMLDILQKGQ